MLSRKSAIQGKRRWVKAICGGIAISIIYSFIIVVIGVSLQPRKGTYRDDENEAERARLYFLEIIEHKDSDSFTMRLRQRPTLLDIKRSVGDPSKHEGDIFTWSVIGDDYRARFGKDGRLVWFQEPEMIDDEGVDPSWTKFHLAP